MKTFTFEELAEKFGVRYRSSTLGIEEVFNGWGYMEEEKLYKTEAEARSAAEAVWYERYDNQVKRIEDILTAYKDLPWYTRAFCYVFKRGWKAKSIVKQKMQEFEDELNDSLSRVANMELKRLPRGGYTLSAPMLEVGQKVYVSVSRKNHLDMGVYAFTIKNIKYSLVFSGTTIHYRADTVNDDGQELQLEVCNDTLSTGYAYHEVHLDKQEAVDRIRGILEDEAKKVAQQLEEIDKEIR